MKINAKKTKLMIISRVANKPQVNITIDGTEIEQVAKFTYLGYLITEDEKCDDEIKGRTYWYSTNNFLQNEQGTNIQNDIIRYKKMPHSMLHISYLNI